MTRYTLTFHSSRLEDGPKIVLRDGQQEVSTYRENWPLNKILDDVDDRGIDMDDVTLRGMGMIGRR